MANSRARKVTSIDSYGRFVDYSEWQTVKLPEKPGMFQWDEPMTWRAFGIMLTWIGCGLFSGGVLYGALKLGAMILRHFGVHITGI